MASAQMLERLKTAYAEFLRITQDPSFRRFQSDVQFREPFAEAQLLASKWISRTKEVGPNIEDWVLQPLAVLLEQAALLPSGNGVMAGETITRALVRIVAQFKTHLPVLAVEVLEANDLFGASERVRRAGESARAAVEAEVNSGTEGIQQVAQKEISRVQEAAKQAVDEFDYVKTEASKISVESALNQFAEAKRQLKHRAIGWTAVSAIFFLLLIFVLFHLFFDPPLLVVRIEQAMRPGTKYVPLHVSIPLLVAASAYFTAVRLALIGVFGIGLAVSLRMMRAYYHMMEHNNHRLRVTSSIQSFVNAIRTATQKDLILGKLVESVTDFGESGILGGQTEGQGWPSVVMESITKNVSKPD